MMGIANNKIIDGAELKTVLGEQIAYASKDIVLISAFLTQTAVDWLLNNIKSSKIKVTIVCRLHPKDILDGATNISAIKTAINAGVSVSCLHSLHAKIYKIDEESIYVGSANFTSNGLCIYGKGNIEACCKIEATAENKSFINRIVDASNPIDLDILDQMEAALNQKSVNPYVDFWPDDIIRNQEGLWVRDMFWCNLNNESLDNNMKIHDLDILKMDFFDPNNDTFKKRVEFSRSIKWLINRLIDNGNELYFGTLTKLLHDELMDDPAPYRQDVKTLVQNLISYCEICMPNSFKVDRPNYSQRITLLMTG